jgi:hypothetical protein
MEIEMNAELIFLVIAAALVAAAVHLTFRRAPRRALFLFDVITATFGRASPPRHRPLESRFTESDTEGSVAKRRRTSQWFPVGATRRAGSG